LINHFRNDDTIINDNSSSLNAVFHICLHVEQQAILSFVAVALLAIGLVGNGFEMRKIRLSITR